MYYFHFVTPPVWVQSSVMNVRPSVCSSVSVC